MPNGKSINAKLKWFVITTAVVLVGLFLVIDWIGYTRSLSRLEEVRELAPVGSNWDEVEMQLTRKGFLITEKILSSSDINNATSQIPRSIKQVRADGFSFSATLLQIFGREGYYEIDLSVEYGEGPKRRNIIGVRKR